ncbi:MAG: C69 family dipeptidase, partial [Lachnospiraceae bacterium]|nr:C69 family dipeptidase [Lachnospiraceae bacterium]
QNIFFDCKDVTVEKLYELGGYRYEDMDYSDRDTVRFIGTNGTAETHIFQIRSDMPAELATVQWVCMGNPDCSTFVPFYGALLTDTSDAYKMEAPKYNSKSAYWIFRSLGFLCEDGENRDLYSKGVKDFYKVYMTKMEALQKQVDKEILTIYNTDKANLEYYATNLGIAAGDQAMGFARTMYDEVSECVSYNKYKKANRPARTFDQTSIDPSTIVYDLSMVEAPKKEDKPEVKPAVKAPVRVKMSAKAVKGKKVKVKLHKISGVKGYEIAYSTSVNFGKKKTKIVKTSVAVKTIKKLKKGKTYYVKARAYKMNGKTKVYGKWSLISRVKVK